MENVKFYIQNFSYCNEPNELIKTLPMLLRRKLSSLDKIALSAILEIYEDDIEQFVFSSQYGESERLFSLIEQYTTENEVSPAYFSASVHNYPAGVLALSKSTNIPYYAISSGKNSLSAGLIKSVLSGKKTLFCYADERSIACIISPHNKKINVDFKKKYFADICEYDEFLKFLKGGQSEFKTSFGVFYA